LTPFKKPVEGCDIRGIWKKIVDEVGLEARISAIEEFNRANKYKKRGYGMQLGNFKHFSLRWS
jgi:xanthine dehydrogenase/oxidase